MRKTKSKRKNRILSLVVVLLLLPTMMFAIQKVAKSNFKSGICHCQRVFSML